MSLWDVTADGTRAAKRKAKEGKGGRRRLPPTNRRRLRRPSRQPLGPPATPGAASTSLNPLGGHEVQRQGRRRGHGRGGAGGTRAARAPTQRVAQRVMQRVMADGEGG